MATNPVGASRDSEQSRVPVGDKHSEAVLTPEHSETPPKPSFEIPFPRNDYFVERKAILDQLRRTCVGPGSRAALVGPGGAGKSQLAVEHAYRVRDIFKKENQEIWVFWVHAGTRARVEAGFEAIADAVGIPGRNQPGTNVLQLVYQWLQDERHEPWLMILDCADDANVFYGTTEEGAQTGTPGEERRALWTYLPQNSNGSILITTRDKELALKLTGPDESVIEVGPMGQDDALTLFAAKLGSQYDRDDAIKLVETLKGIPLAISQAAAYIQQTTPRISVAEYLNVFHKSEQKQDGGAVQRVGDTSNSVMTTWQMSFDHLRSTRPSATELLSLMSFFDRQGISASLLRPINKTQSPNLENHIKSAGVGPDVSLNNAFDEDVTILRNYCLVDANEVGDIFEIHGLVQLSTRKWLAASGEAERFMKQYISRMAKAFPTGDSRNWGTCQKLFPHVKGAVEYHPVDRNALGELALLLYNGSWYAIEQSKYDAAETMAEISRDIRNTVLGPEHPLTLASLANIASTYRNRKRWAEAESLEVKLLDARKRALGPSHPDTLTSMSNLASMYKKQGRGEQAESLFSQVVEARKKSLGPDHPDTLTSMANLGSVYRNQGRLKEAESLFTKVLDGRKAVLGVNHPDILTSMASLASTYWDQWKWNEAEFLEVRVMEARKRVLGQDHLLTLTSMANLASTYKKQNRWNEAESLEAEVVKMRKAILGIEHHSTLASIANLASTYKSQSRWRDAEPLEVQVMETRKKVLGPDHPDTLTSMANLAATYWGQRQWKKAEPLEIEVMETRKSVLGPDNESTLVSMANLASTYKKQGRWKEAEALDIQVVETRKRVLGPTHLDTLTSMANLASTYWDQKRWTDAEPLEVRVMETRKVVLGPDHPSTLTSMANLAFTWNSQGRNHDAFELIEKCAEARMRVLGPSHPDTQSSVSTARSWGVAERQAQKGGWKHTGKNMAVSLRAKLRKSG
ncbi:hypothetical protein F4861DRAFT_287006 [Xylaria intraflava]|nr:hypothetical protein F4861DRAFT_287006 [Xylaria intraflava]